MDVRVSFGFDCERVRLSPARGHLLKAGESKLGQRGVSVCGGEGYRI